MTNSPARIFWAAFFVTLLLAATLFGIACVDRLSGDGGTGSLLGGDIAARDGGTLTLTIGTKQLALDLSPAERWAEILRRYATVLLPRAVRLTAQWGEALRERWAASHPAQPEDGFQNAVFL
jgi:hypothetical protein